MRGSQNGSGLRIAIVADYLNQRGGAEWVVSVLHRMFPAAPIYTTILDRTRLWPGLADADIRPSWMQKLPGVRRYFRHYLPLYYLAIERLDLGAFDVVISSSCAFGLGARAREDAVHVCYCYTPARYIWNYDAYIEKEALGGFARRALPLLIRVLKQRDLAMARRPDAFAGISTAVVDRIRRCYGRDGVVIHPPVNIQRFSAGTGSGDYYLVVSRLNAYKRIELAVRAFNRLGLPLVIVGDGPDRPRLERLAGPNVRFAGWLSDSEVARAYRDCRALVFPGEEDFGIAIIEAAASGRPVIAFRGGGALDTVIDGATGHFFADPTAEALSEAVARSRTHPWKAAEIRAHAEGFSVEKFTARFGDFVEATVSSGLGVRVPLCV